MIVIVHIYLFSDVGFAMDDETARLLDEKKGCEGGLTFLETSKGPKACIQPAEGLDCWIKKKGNPAAEMVNNFFKDFQSYYGNGKNLRFCYDLPAKPDGPSGSGTSTSGPSV